MKGLLGVITAAVFYVLESCAAAILALCRLISQAELLCRGFRRVLERTPLAVVGLASSTPPPRRQSPPHTPLRLQCILQLLSPMPRSQRWFIPLRPWWPSQQRLPSLIPQCPRWLDCLLVGSVETAESACFTSGVRSLVQMLPSGRLVHRFLWVFVTLSPEKSCG